MRSVIIVRIIEHIALAVDHLAVLRDRRRCRTGLRHHSTELSLFVDIDGMAFFPIKFSGPQWSIKCSDMQKRS